MDSKSESGEAVSPDKSSVTPDEVDSSPHPPIGAESSSSQVANWADKNTNASADSQTMQLSADPNTILKTDTSAPPDQHSTVQEHLNIDQISNGDKLQGRHSDTPQETVEESHSPPSTELASCGDAASNGDSDKVKSCVSELSASDNPSTIGSIEPESSQENQNTSVASSPVSNPTSGQDIDSGVSPDESSSDVSTKTPVVSGTPQEEQASTKECENRSEKSRTPEADLNSASHPQSLSHSHTNMSSDTNTSASETQVTVSDLDSPPADTKSASASDDSKTTPTEVAAAAAANADHESVYYIKWIMFGQNNVPIITQNENGPCPLLAIMNVLLLKGKVKLAPMLEMVTSEQLMTFLGECILENKPQNLSETIQANYEQNMQDAMGVMYKLQTGLDVNVKFTGVGDFEYTPELIIFDLLEISLFHGWLVDPQDVDTVRAVNQCSYNQLVEKIISLKHSEQEENVTQALIAEQFLDRTASQLTYHGLCELSSVVKEKELCVFFRNNHFNTLYKNNNELFLLVTDQGFLTEANVVWETLSNVDGDGHFTDATFRTYTKPAPPTDPIPDPSVPVGSPEQIDHDYQVALFLQEEATTMEDQAWGGNAGGQGYQQEHASYAQADHELAMRLQEEENRRALAEQQRAATAAGGQPAAQGQPGQGQGRAQGQGPHSEAQRRRGDRGDRREKEDKNCSIL